MDPAFCVAVTPGAHPASFWASGYGGWDPQGASAALDATFYQGLDCTGPLRSGDSVGGALDLYGAWTELAGTLVAPAGTQSALFRISGEVGFLCDDWCGGAAAYVDDVYVEGTTVPAPPQTWIISGPVPLTNATSATFEFIASEPSTFECSFDAAPFEDCTSPASYTGLADGSHAFHVRATNTAGNTDATPAKREWTIDTTPPETTIVAGPSGTTNFPGATFVFTASEPVWWFQCSLDGSPFAGSGCTSPWDYGPLADGPHTFRVRASDGVNIDPTPAERTWAVQTNAPPTARFTFNCTALTCSFDGSGSADPDGSIASYTWDFGDGASGNGATVSHSYGRAGSYTVTLTVTDSGGVTATDSKAVAPISLTARGYKQGGLWKVDRSWSGPSPGTSFDVYRNGVRIATVQATAYTDIITKKGSYTYKVCAPSTSSCSNEAKVSF